MKKFDLNQKIGIIALLIFIVFLVAFYIWGGLIQSGALPDFTANQRIQGVLAFVMFLPFLVSLFFWGRYFKSKSGQKIGGILTFVSVALFLFAAIQTLLSLLGVYGS